MSKPGQGKQTISLSQHYDKKRETVTAVFSAERTLCRALNATRIPFVCLPVALLSSDGLRIVLLF